MDEISLKMKNPVPKLMLLAGRFEPTNLFLNLEPDLGFGSAQRPNFELVYVYGIRGSTLFVVVEIQGQ